MALATWITVRSATQPHRGRLLISGLATMLLSGVALQIKPSYVVQAIYLGLVLQFASYNADRSLIRLLGRSAAWVMAAVLPTLLAAIWYLARGHFDEFIQANFVSILSRRDDASGIATRMWKQLALISPLIGPSLVLAIRRKKLTAENRRLAVLLLGWSAAAFCGYLLLPAAHYAYVLPLLPALLATALMGLATVLTSPLHLAVAGAMLFGWGGAFGFYRQLDHGVSLENAAELRAMAGIIEPLLGRGCLYVHSGPPILYRQTDSCVATPFFFPGHLSDVTRPGELGRADVLTETAKLLASKPAVIVAIPGDLAPTAAPGPVMQSFTKAIRCHYHNVGLMQFAGQNHAVFARNTGSDHGTAPESRRHHCD